MCTTRLFDCQYVLDTLDKAREGLKQHREKKWEKEKKKAKERLEKRALRRAKWWLFPRAYAPVRDEDVVLLLMTDDESGYTTYDLCFRNSSGAEKLFNDVEALARDPNGDGKITVSADDWSAINSWLG